MDIPRVSRNGGKKIHIFQRHNPYGCVEKKLISKHNIGIMITVKV